MSCSSGGALGNTRGLTNIVKNSTKSSSESAGQGSQGVPDPKVNKDGSRPSAGPLGRLEQHATEVSERQAATGWRRMAGMGIEFFGVVLICALVGMWFDDRFKLHGLGTLGGIVIGVVGGTYLQIRTFLWVDKK